MNVARSEIVAASADYRTPPNPYASGYGSRIPTRYWVMLPTESRWRKVYAMCYGNSASLYVKVKGTDTFISETELAAMLDHNDPSRGLDATRRYSTDMES